MEVLQSSGMFGHGRSSTVLLASHTTASFLAIRTMPSFQPVISNII